MLQGCAVVSLTLIAFIGLVWLREQILHGGGPEWLDNDLEHANIAADAAHVANWANAANNNNAVNRPEVAEDPHINDEDDHAGMQFNLYF